VTRASQAARRWLARDRRRVRRVARDVHAVALQTGDRAYQFIDFQDGSLLEVRVWPDGSMRLTEVDAAGNPVAVAPPPKVHRVR
jgi:hypothetical protein